MVILFNSSSFDFNSSYLLSLSWVILESFLSTSLNKELFSFCSLSKSSFSLFKIEISSLNNSIFLSFSFISFTLDNKSLIFIFDFNDKYSLLRLVCFLFKFSILSFKSIFNFLSKFKFSLILTSSFSISYLSSFTLYISSVVLVLSSSQEITFSSKIFNSFCFKSISFCNEFELYSPSLCSNSSRDFLLIISTELYSLFFKVNSS